MTYGFKIVQEMISGPVRFMDEKGYRDHRGFPRRAIPR